MFAEFTWTYLSSLLYLSHNILPNKPNTGTHTTRSHLTLYCVVCFERSTSLANTSTHSHPGSAPSPLLYSAPLYLHSCCVMSFMNLIDRTNLASQSNAIFSNGIFSLCCCSCCYCCCGYCFWYWLTACCSCYCYSIGLVIECYWIEFHAEICKLTHIVEQRFLCVCVCVCSCGVSFKCQKNMRLINNQNFENCIFNNNGHMFEKKNTHTLKTSRHLFA